MTFEQVVRSLRLRVTPTQRYACEFLESRGQVFRVHFGTKNAIAKAAELFVDECHEKERRA